MTTTRVAYSRRTAGLLAALVITPVIIGTLGAQASGPSSRPAAAAPSAASPWTVTLSPQVLPLRAGTCDVVSVGVLDASGKEVPKTPQGQRVTIADFDMSAAGSSDKTIYGEYSGANYWSVCSCKTTRPGTIARITATYPAATIPAARRVPGVAFTSSIAIPIAALPANANNSPRCSGIITTTQPGTSPR